MKFQVKQTFEILSNTPGVLKSLLENLSGGWIESDEGDEGWNPFDTVGHLIHGEKTDWIPRAKIILNQGENASFESFDRFAQFENSKGKTLSELLFEFERRRKENLEILKSFDLTEKDLKLKAVHPELGEVNLGQLLSTWAVHDLTHIRQITVFLAKKYSENVGVWKDYLSILN